MAVGKRGKRVVIDFRCYLPNGRRVRCAEYEGIANKANIKRANSKWKAIEYALNNNSFNYLKFFPHGSKAKRFSKRDSTLPLSEWWNLWFSEKSLRRATENAYEQTYRNHIGPFFDGIEIGAISEHDLLVFRKKLETEGIKASTINTYMKPLCQSLFTAQTRGLIEAYPCANIGRIEEEPTQVNPLSFEELRHWFDYLKENNLAWHDLILFWSRTGLRPGELYALRWEHIDYFNRKAMVRLARKPGEDGLPKTTHSIRDIDLRPTVIDALKRQEGRTGLMGTMCFLREINAPSLPPA